MEIERKKKIYKIENRDNTITAGTTEKPAAGRSEWKGVVPSDLQATVRPSGGGSARAGREGSSAQQRRSVVGQTSLVAPGTFPQNRVAPRRLVSYPQQQLRNSIIFFYSSFSQLSCRVCSGVYTILSVPWIISWSKDASGRLPGLTGLRSISGTSSLSTTRMMMMMMLLWSNEQPRLPRAP